MPRAWLSWPRCDAGPGGVGLAPARGDNVVPIPGTKHASRMAENPAAAGITLTEDQVARLGAIQAPVGDRYADMSRVNR